MAIVGDGLALAKDYLATEKAEREQYYYDLVYNPEKFATEPTTVTDPSETTPPTE